MGKKEKTKEERLKEGISLLTQLKDTGVHGSSLSFIELKEKVTQWIETGVAWEGVIEFPDYGRVAEVSFPRYNNKAADLHFKVKK